MNKYGVVTSNRYDYSIRWHEELGEAVEDYEDTLRYTSRQNVFIVQMLDALITYTSKDGIKMESRWQ